MKSGFEPDWVMVRNGVEELKDYLLSTQLYWPLPAAGGFMKTAPVTSLTPGNLLLSLRRLLAVPLEPGEQTQVAEWKTQIDQIREHWRAAWGRKAAAEYSARLDSWRSYLYELTEKPAGGKSEYPNSVRGRCILELLRSESGPIASSSGQSLTSLDHRLQSISKPGPFVWEPDVESAFPPDRFWFLYISLA